MPTPVSKGVNSQGNSYTTYSNGGYSYSNAPSSSNSNSGSHYYSPSGGTSGFYTQNGASAPTHLLTRTTNRSSLIMPFRVWQVDNRVAGTPTTRTLQERARISESCDLSYPRAPRDAGPNRGRPGERHALGAPRGPTAVAAARASAAPLDVLCVGRSPPSSFLCVLCVCPSSSGPSPLGSVVQQLHKGILVKHRLFHPFSGFKTPCTMDAASGRRSEPRQSGPARRPPDGDAVRIGVLSP